MDNNQCTAETVDEGWINEAIQKEFIKKYDFRYFDNNIEMIGSGGFGKVYRARWRNTTNLALKSFNLNSSNTINEIVREVNIIFI